MPDTPPPRLYKYQPLTAQTLAALKVRTLWFGRPSRLNDPYDCKVPWRLRPVTRDEFRRLLKDRSDPDWKRFVADVRYVSPSGEPTPAMLLALENAGKEQFGRFAADSYEKRGVTCFSEVPDSTLLWSHYGGGHKGMCLEFDTSSPWLNRLHRVRYTDELPELSVVDMLLDHEVDILALLLTKATCWSYEREWRAIHHEADKEYCYGVEALTGVYLGAALTPAEKDVVCHLLQKDVVCHLLHGTPTKLFHMRRSENSFALQAQPVNYTPYRHD